MQSIGDFLGPDACAAFEEAQAGPLAPDSSVLAAVLRQLPEVAARMHRCRPPRAPRRLVLQRGRVEVPHVGMGQRHRVHYPGTLSAHDDIVGLHICLLKPRTGGMVFARRRQSHGRALRQGEALAMSSLLSGDGYTTAPVLRGRAVHAFVRLRWGAAAHPGPCALPRNAVVGSVDPGLLPRLPARLQVGQVGQWLGPATLASLCETSRACFAAFSADALWPYLCPAPPRERPVRPALGLFEDSVDEFEFEEDSGLDCLDPDSEPEEPDEDDASRKELYTRRRRAAARAAAVAREALEAAELDASPWGDDDDDLFSDL